MSSPMKQECCVCGAPSTMRCSGCLQDNVSLYFCSKEHQKLVWFAHKPVCGRLRASFMLLPDLTPFETRLLQSPAVLQTLSKRRPRGTHAKTIDELIVTFKGAYQLDPGSYLQNVHRMNKWLKTLAVQPHARGILRVLANCLLSDFVHSPDGGATDPLEMPAHAFALDVYMWHNITQSEVPLRQMYAFLHGSTIWAGLLRILAGRVTVAGVDSSFVTPDFVAAYLERLLQTMQADLDLTIDVIGGPGGLLPLVSQPLHSVPAMSRYNVRISTVAGDPANNRIFVDRPGEGARSERLEQTDT